MTSKLLCPAGHWLSVDESQEGQRVVCPRCYATMTIPYSSPAAEGERASFKRSASGFSAKPPLGAAAKPPFSPVASNGGGSNGSAAKGGAASGRFPPRSLEPDDEIRGANGHALAVAAASRVSNGSAGPNRAHPKPSADAGPVVTAVATSRPVAKPAAPNRPSLDAAQLAYAAAERAAVERLSRKPRTYGVSLVIALFALFQVAPIFLEKSFASAPQWAQATLLLAALEIAYAVWVALTPDWAAPQVAMLLFGVVSALYGVALGICLFSPPGGRVFFDLDQSPGKGPLWFLVMLFGALTVTHFAGWTAYAWRSRQLQQ